MEELLEFLEVLAGAEGLTELLAGATGGEVAEKGADCTLSFFSKLEILDSL
jgi:hypothetical protein